MSRIGSYGASQLYLSRLSVIQQRLNLAQTQVATELKSTNYTGIATDSNQLINMQNEKAQATQYTKNNNFASTRLEAAQNSVTAAQSIISQFKSRLDTFMQGNTKDQTKIKELQEWAVKSMVETQSYLNTNVDGQYLFSGGRVSTSPVQLPATSLTAFQAKYDGFNHTFPTTRAANLQDLALTSATTGSVNFNATTGTIIPTNAGSYNDVAAGSLVTVGGTTSNNKDFTVTGHAATNVNSKPLAETANAGANAFITTSTGNVLNATTGNLRLAFDPQGQMTLTPTTPNTLSNMIVGTKFTIKGSTDGDGDTFGDSDGAYIVTGNANGVVTLANDTDTAKNETMDVGSLVLSRDTNANGVPDTVAGLGAITGNATFAVSGTTVTMTVPPGGTNLTTLFSAADPITIAGSSDHNGTFKVGSVTANTVTFQINPDALRTSQFVPQTGRTDVTISFDGEPKVFNGGAYGSLTFSPTGAGGETITAATANAFTDSNGVATPRVGDVIKLDSTSKVNDGAYKVVSNDGTNIVIESTTVATEASATSTLSSTSWYKGDTINLQHRIDVDTTVNVSMYASDPAFEKAFRAMGLIAQGQFGTAGGLDNNQDRLSAARYLINDALEAPAAGTPPYGTELRSSLQTLQSNIGVVQSVLKDRNTKHQQFSALFDQRISDVANVDKAEAITRLLDDQNALQASYQALSTVRGLSLLNYMK